MRYHKLLAIIIIIFLGVVAYSNSFLNSFHFDDVPSITDNLAIRDIRFIQNIWRFWPTRFVTYLSVALNYRLCGFNVFGYHVFNFAVHLASAISVWWLVLLTFNSPLMKKDTMSQHAGRIAFFTSAVFMLHPIQTQPVNYIIQRATLLAAFFSITSVCLYAKARLKFYERPASLAGKLYYIGSVSMAIIAMFSKEMAVSLPFIICLYEFYFFSAKKNISWKYIIVFFAIAILIPMTIVLTKSLNFKETNRIGYLLTQLRVMATYLRLVFMPINQNFDYDYPAVKTAFSSPVILSSLLIVVILSAGIRLLKKYRLVSFSIFWFFIALLPESSVIPIKDVIFEHRLYLPMAGFSLLLISSLYYLFADKSIRIVAATLFMLIACNLALTYERNKAWKDELTLWDDTVHKSPNKARPYNNRGTAYINNGNDSLAISDFNKAIEIDHSYVDAYYNRGNAYNKRGNFDKALSDFNKAIEINPGYAYAYNNRGLTFIHKGNVDRALSDFNKAIEINPGYADAYNNRGLIFIQEGNIDKALSDFNKAIEINPGYAYSYNNRGNAYFKKENYDQAILDCTKAIEINPDDAGFYYNRGTYYYKKGNYSKAREDVDKASSSGYRVDPDFINVLKKASM